MDKRNNIEDIVREIVKVKVFISREDVAKKMAEQLVQHIKIVEVQYDSQGNEYWNGRKQDPKQKEV